MPPSDDRFPLELADPSRGPTAAQSAGLTLNAAKALMKAAMDLGATYPGTLRLVVVPMAMPAIISAWITAFTVSFDEFAIALFLAGPDRTFPVYLYGQLRFANSLPVLIAAATLLMAGTLTLILVADRIRKR